MYSLVFAFLHFHYDLNKVTVEAIKEDIRQNDYFDDENIENQVLDLVQEVYNQNL